MQLIARCIDAELSIPLDDFTRELLLLQYQKAEAADDIQGFAQSLANKIRASLQHSTDNELMLPTEKQTAFALDISRELGVSIPADALRYRAAMTAFLARFADQFRERRANR